MWKSKAALQALVEQLQERVKTLEEDKKFLQEQVLQLKDALIAREVPHVYHEYKRNSSTPLSEDEDVKRQRKIINYTQMITSEMEQPLFRDADDMISNLQRVIGFPGTSEIIPSDES